MTKINEALTPAQLHILAAFRKQPAKSLTFKQLKELTGTKSHSLLQTTISKFCSLQFIEAEKVADVTSYRLKFTNNSVLDYLAIIDQQQLRKNDAVFHILKQTALQLEKRTEFYILLVFGSHATGKATANSDVDLAVIVENDDVKKNVWPELQIIRRKSLSPADFQIFTRAEFLEMLQIEEENVGKEIARKNLIFQGAESYFKMINKVLDETNRKTLFGTR
jgi:predicted nucleotidyltransferase